jgi:hypothetical protein
MTTSPAPWTHICVDDTCCINKRGSPELSETTNQIFSWHSDAAVCYMVLEDIPNASKLPIADIDSGASLFRQCR